MLGIKGLRLVFVRGRNHLNESQLLCSCLALPRGHNMGHLASRSPLPWSDERQVVVEVSVGGFSNK